ncbi:PstS family phosphate ABC transporter substrate-binding protein [Porphyromonas circumdentaria]|uniref:PstS family phosphate ABC transporter substrate-binding protein n=1 Tax=Porphyromonas circumdentaria TaxID=29524 RepID=UPI0026DD50EA|nr:PstS family phosphate ABC transporter substrate-binding protein [Porphyromonas circumdentaria]MDO4721955.1 PstS family phosphate ABC transporter substrate-binding protein [Porphyromonas circumdentaria]
MKKTVITALLMSMVAASLYGQRVKGSDTVIPLSQKEAEGYMKENPSARLTITGGGSGVGFSALLEGTTDIAQASRRIKFPERQKMQEKGINPKEVVIAYDALAVVVNPANKVSKLTREQLEGIFTGKIKNWKEVGGDDMKIIPYSRETSSGTYEFFKEVVMKNKNYMNGIMSMSATGVIIQSVTQTKGAIGYVGMAYLNKDVKAVSVSFDGGKKFIAPSVKNAKNSTYPIVRPLYYYYDAKIERQVKPFVDYVLSPKGQAIVDKVGFISIK